MNVHTDEIRALRAALAHRSAQRALKVKMSEALEVACGQTQAEQDQVSEIERTLQAFTAAGASALQHSEQERDAIAQVTACRQKLLQANTSQGFARARELAIETKLKKAVDDQNLAEQAVVNAERSLRNADMIDQAHQCIALQEKLKSKVERLRVIAFRDGLNTPLCDLGDPVPPIVEQVVARMTARNDLNTPVTVLRGCGTANDRLWSQRLAELMSDAETTDGVAA